MNGSDTTSMRPGSHLLQRSRKKSQRPVVVMGVLLTFERVVVVSVGEAVEVGDVVTKDGVVVVGTVAAGGTCCTGFGDPPRCISTNPITRTTSTAAAVSTGA